MRLLVVEDEDLLAEGLVRGLRKNGFAVDLAIDGLSALEKASINDYDVIVLDRDLPGLHGDEVCKKLRSEGYPARILMLTASGAVEARVEGLRLGADDYLPKPFAFIELIERIRSLGRRSAPAPQTIEIGDLLVDLRRKDVCRAGKQISLTSREFAILEILVKAAGGVVGAEELLERAWDENTDPFTNSPRVLLMRLRRKLGDPPLIDTVVGAGYRLRESKSPR